MHANSWNSKDQKGYTKKHYNNLKGLYRILYFDFQKTFANQETVVVLKGTTAIRTTTKICEPVILFLENITIK